METPPGYVTSDKWFAKHLNNCPAIWTMSSGSKALVQLTGYLMAINSGAGMIVVFKTAHGYQRNLTQREMDNATLDDDGIFRFQ
jgi:hypothetical protein